MTRDPNQQHLDEILENQKAWDSKPRIQKIYRDFFQRVNRQLSSPQIGDRVVVELGSGMGRLKSVIPDLVTTDIFPNPWIDQVCSAYHMPFEDGTVTDLVLIDVFHHLERPVAFFHEATRVLVPGGRVIILDPFISILSTPVYGWVHHEPIGKPSDIQLDAAPPTHPGYYAAQGNATHLFFRNCTNLTNIPLNISHRESWSCLEYFLSGGFSKPALIPESCNGFLKLLDRGLSKFPALFAGRCLVTLQTQKSENL